MLCTSQTQENELGETISFSMVSTYSPACTLCLYPYNLPKDPEHGVSLCTMHSTRYNHYNKEPWQSVIAPRIHSILHTKTSDKGELFYHVVLADVCGGARNFWEAGATRWIPAREWATLQHVSRVETTESTLYQH